MRKQITWNEVDCNTVEGYGINLTYHFSTFDKKEFDELKEWCEKHIKSGIIIEGAVELHLKKED